VPSSEIQSGHFLKGLIEKHDKAQESLAVSHPRLEPGTSRNVTARINSIDPKLYC
jgi:hypothetical protein